MIIDEIGKMELCSDRFLRYAKNTLADGRTVVLATVPVKCPYVVERMKERDDSMLMEVTRGNRENMSQRILENVLAAIESCLG